LADELSFKIGNIDPTKLAKAHGMEIFLKPNPATDWITFDYKLPEGETSAILLITEPTGKIIETLSLEGNRGQELLDTRNYISGAYLYQMILGEMNLPGKFIIVK